MKLFIAAFLLVALSSLAMAADPSQEGEDPRPEKRHVTVDYSHSGHPTYRQLYYHRRPTYSSYHGGSRRQYPSSSYYYPGRSRSYSSYRFKRSPQLPEEEEEFPAAFLAAQDDPQDREEKARFERSSEDYGSLEVALEEDNREAKQVDPVERLTLEDLADLEVNEADGDEDEESKLEKRFLSFGIYKGGGLGGYGGGFGGIGYGRGYSRGWYNRDRYYNNYYNRGYYPSRRTYYF